MPRIQTRRILIGDVDSAGIAFTGRLIAIALEGFELGMHSLGVDFAGMVRECAYLTPVVHLDANFAKPMRHGDTIHLELACERIGDCSFTIRINLIPDGVSTPAATVSIVSACIDGATHTAIPIPTTLATCLNLIRIDTSG